MDFLESRLTYLILTLFSVHFKYHILKLIKQSLALIVYKKPNTYTNTILNTKQ